MGETAAEVPVLDWKGAYSSSWVGILSPGSMAHPAKFSRGLLDRLLDHGFARGWWEKGSILGDPFGGVGCGGILAAYKGLGWIGIELESRFTSVARENFAKHRRRWEAAGDPRPVILRGDSRHFARLVRTGLAAIITSPPYADGVHGRNGIDIGKCERPGATSQARAGGYGDTGGQVGRLREGDLDAVVTSPLDGGSNCPNNITPPFKTTFTGDQCHEHRAAGKAAGGKPKGSRGVREDMGAAQGRDVLALSGAELVASPDGSVLRGRTENRTEGDGSARAAVEGEGAARGAASPLQGRAVKHPVPDADREGQVRELWGDGEVIDPPQEHRPLRQPVGEPGSAVRALSHQSGQEGVVGGEESRAAVAEGQRAGGLEIKEGLTGIVTSPPYADSQVGSGNEGRKGWRGYTDIGGGEFATPGQVSALPADTYWLACKQIYTQCLLALRPNGIMCVVLKSYVRDGAVVDLPGQTLRLLCSLGFTPVERIRAWLVEERREPGLFGGEVVERKSRKSFFRRLHEKKRPGTEIDFEEVLVVRAPGGGTCPDTYDSAGGP